MLPVNGPHSTLLAVCMPSCSPVGHPRLSRCREIPPASSKVPDACDPQVQAIFALNEDESHVRAIEGMARRIKTWKGGAGEQVTIVSSGP